MSRMITKRLEVSMKIWAVAVFCMLLAACATAPGKASFDNAERLKLTVAANNGDKDAQYQLGNNYCCGEPGGFWDTKEAVKWWCRAAEQGRKEALAAVAQAGGSCPNLSRKL